MSYRVRAAVVDDKLLKLTNPIIVRTLKNCESVLKQKKNYVVSVIPTNDEFVTKNMGGATGLTVNFGKISIHVSTRSKNWKSSLKSTVAHEFNHIIRIHYLNLHDLEKNRLIDTIASEGLAQVFEEEITGRRSTYSKSVTSGTAKRIWKIMKSYNKNDYYDKFFINGNDKTKEYPLWCGYTVAYLIVKKRKMELGLSWPELMKMGAKELVENGLV